MTAILGIDAAWTGTNASGVALGVREDGIWRIRRAASSYGAFLGRPGLPDTLPPIAGLLAEAERCAGRPIGLACIDMPLSRQPITARRAADNAVSRAYGGRKAGTHTPSAVRPGPISDTMTAQFAAAGYPLLTGDIRLPGLIEVYPHPALIELTGAPERLTYKEARRRIYWPDLAPPERVERLVDVWERIVAALETRMEGVAAHLPRLSASPTRRELKAHEDALDAIICVWVGIEAVEGRARPHGDDSAAIWIPLPRDGAA